MENTKAFQIARIIRGVLEFGIIVALILAVVRQGSAIEKLNKQVADLATTTAVVDFLITPDSNGVTGFTKTVYQSNVLISQMLQSTSTPKK